MVNRFDRLYVERNGRLQETPYRFTGEPQLRRVIERIVARVGRRIDESSPLVDARLEDGSRVNAIIPPLAVDGASLTIRKFAGTPYTAEDLDQFRQHDARGYGSPRRRGAGEDEHPRLGRYRYRQDHAAQRALVVHPRRRAHHHHRRRGRAATAAGARRTTRVAPAQHRGAWRDHHPRSRAQLAAHAPRPHRRRRGAWGRDRSTCCRR